MKKEKILNSKNKALPIFLIIFVASLIYANSLKNSFVWDDYCVIVDNSFVKSWKNFPLIFTKSYLTPIKALNSGNITGSGETSYRPIVTASYFLDYHFWKLNPFGYHLSNLALHILNAILLYLFVNLLLRNKYIAMLASLFFALHPVNTEAVNVVSFREDLLAFLFYIASFIIFIKKDQYQGRRRVYYYCFSVILFLLALFSKEIAITLLVMLLIYDYFFVFNQNWRKFIPCIDRRYVGYFLAAVFYLACWLFLKKGLGDFTEEYPYPGGSFYTNLLTMSRVVATYMGWLFFPIDIHATLPENNPALTAYSFNPLVGLSILLIALSLLFALKVRSRMKEITFAIAWFFITLLPAANLVPISCIIAGRYLYLPSAGFSILMAVALFKLYNLETRKFSTQEFHKIARSVLIILLIGYSMFTFIRNMAWKNNLVLWQELAERHPGNIDAHINLATQFKRSGLSERALAEYAKVIQLEPNSPRGYDLFGLTLGEKGEYAEAIGYLQKAISKDAKYVDAYNNLGITYARMGKWGEAKLTWSRALEIDPRYEPARLNLEKLQ